MKTLLSISLAALVVITGCSKDNDTTTDAPSLSKAQLGEKLFFDKNLSLTRQTSCATCHDPEHGFVDARFSEQGTDQSIFIHGAFSVGDDDVSLGGRNAPTATYAQFTPDFGKNTNDEYLGGQFHDGRADSLKIQAMGPPLDGAEMQMPDKANVVERIQENESYIAAFKNLYGDSIFDDINATYESMAESIAKFEKTEVFAPFDSKYDRFLSCREEGVSTNTCLSADNWTTEEELGYSLFFSEANTNCAQCHSINSSGEAPSHELFTNFKYENIGTPRNIAAMDARAALGLQDANATFKGLGGTVNEPAQLGKTKVPTLRNIAVTAPYMNNGVFKELRTVIEFYDHMADNDDHPNNPETGTPWVANDNNTTINHTLLQNTQALDDVKIRALEAFLRTLTDQKYEHLMSPLAP